MSAAPGRRRGHRSPGMPSGPAAAIGGGRELPEPSRRAVAVADFIERCGGVLPQGGIEVEFMDRGNWLPEDAAGAISELVELGLARWREDGLTVELIER